MIVGLTGRYCAGKDSVARIFGRNGFRVIDVDGLGHQALAEKADEVAAAFGQTVRDTAGGIDRRVLGRIVFADPRALARLESIVHPAMAERVRRLVAEGRGDTVVNAAVLHRMGLAEACDAVVWVTAPAPLRLLRALRRDGTTLGKALARMRAQSDLRPQLNGPAVDTYTVRNGGTARSLERRVAALARRLKGGEG
jgi:dephospho-CoA kinase